MRWTVAEEVIDIHVFGPSQRFQRHCCVEMIRINGTAVG